MENLEIILKQKGNITGALATALVIAKALKVENLRVDLTCGSEVKLIPIPGHGGYTTKGKQLGLDTEWVYTLIAPSISTTLPGGETQEEWVHPDEWAICSLNEDLAILKKDAIRLSELVRKGISNLTDEECREADSICSRIEKL